jgi:uncharacterized membrane protein
MTILVIGLLLFLGTHSLAIFASGWRHRTVARVGEQTYQGIYSLLAIAGFVLIIWGYGLARQEPHVLYLPPVWLRHSALLIMVPVFPLLLAAYLPGRIQSAAKHPMLMGVALWSFAHLLANGMVADLILFGSFLLWSILNRFSMKWREPLPVQGAPPSKLNDLIAVAAGLALYAAFVYWLHPWLIGVPVVG